MIPTSAKANSFARLCSGSESTRTPSISKIRPLADCMISCGIRFPDPGFASCTNREIAERRHRGDCILTFPPPRAPQKSCGSAESRTTDRIRNRSYHEEPRGCFLQPRREKWLGCCHHEPQPRCIRIDRYAFLPE